MLFSIFVFAIPFAPGDLVRTPSAPDAWGGPREFADAVVAYDIEAKLDPKTHTVHGKEIVTWRNRSDLPISTVYFHLYLNAFSSHDSTMLTEAAEDPAAGHAEILLDDTALGACTLVHVLQNSRAVSTHFVHPDGGPESDKTVVALELPEPVAPHTTTQLDIAFDSLMPKEGDRTGFRNEFYLIAQWFPKIGVLELPGERGATQVRWNVHEYHLFSEFYADYGDYDVHLYAPPEYQIAAVGEGAPETRGGEKWFHFKQSGVHDFAWMAAKDFAPPLHDTWRNSRSHAVSVDVFFPEEYRASAERCLCATKDALSDFSDEFFPYPYRTLTCVVPPFGTNDALGGMEYPTFFTAEGVADPAPDTFDRYNIDFTALHEFGHGYFYGLIGSNEFEEPLLDEGLNSYWDSVFAERRGQRMHLASRAGNVFGFGMSISFAALDHFAYAGLSRATPDVLAGNAWHRRSFDSYESVYYGTSAVMHTLANLLLPGELERGMQSYVRTWRFRHPSTADLEASLAATTQTPAMVHDVFAHFIYDGEVVDDRVASVTSRALLPEASIEKSPEVAAKEGTAGTFPFLSEVVTERRGGELPQTLEVEFEDGSKARIAWPTGERWHRFSWSKDVRIRSAHLDPDDKIVIDVNKLDNARLREPAASGLVCLCKRFGAWLHILFAVLVSA